MNAVTPRCQGKNVRTFLCCLDADHDGPCMPYNPPTVDEWRETMVLNRRLAELVDKWQDKCDRLMDILK